MNFNTIIDNINSQEEGQKRKPFELAKDKEILEQSTYYEKRIYDLEQLLDIAKSFCSTLDFSNLLESIVYICMAQMHVLGAEIFVRDPITNDVLNLETAKTEKGEKKLPQILSGKEVELLLRQDLHRLQAHLDFLHLCLAFV